MTLQVIDRVKVRLENTIGSMLEPRTTISIGPDRTITEKDMKLLEKSLDSAIKSQFALGLGNASNQLAGTRLAIKEHNDFQKDKGQVLKLNEVFDFVRTPPEQFIRFRGKKMQFARTTEILTGLPKYVMCSLSKSRAGVELTIIDGRRFRGNIPIIPTAAQELAKRAKAIAPKGTFHLLFEPKWQEQPAPVVNRDPVLLYKVAGRYAVIAAWDNDGQLIMEQLKEVNKGKKNV